MKPFIRTLSLLLPVCLALTGLGCQKTVMPASDKTRFDRQVDELVSEVL